MWTRLTLQRLYCLFMIEAGSRFVASSGHRETARVVTTRQIRNLLMHLGDRRGQQVPGP